MCSSYEVNLYIFYEAFESFEINFKHSSGERKKCRDHLLKKKQHREKQHSIVYKGLKSETLLAV